MSLTAWYKLNGDLLDSSGNENHGSINGSALTYVDGVVGKAGVFDGNKNIILPNPEILKVKGELTVSMWVKSNSVPSGTRLDIFFMGRDINSGYGVMSDGGTNFIFMVFTESTTHRLDFAIDDKLTHIVIKYDPLKGIFIYKNGILTYTNKDARGTIKYPEMFTPCLGSHGSSIYKYIGEIQDFRIYDHCLSDKEIYDLSKALCLHYTFDDVEEPTVNLFPVNASLMSIRDGTDSSWELYKDSYDNIIYKFNRVNQTLYEYNGFDISVIVGDKYTLSLDVYVSTDYDRTSGTLVRFEKAISSTFELDNSKKGMWQRAIITGVCSTTILRTLLYPSPETASGTKGYILYRNPQLEKKDHCTPFVNGTRDQIIVRDKSDYGNDSLPLTLANTPAFVEDCKIGRQSVQYPNKKYVETSNVFNFNNTKTISFWFKSPVLTNSKKGVYLLSNPNGTAYIFLGSPSGIPAESSISFSVLFGKTATTYDFDMRIVRGKEIFTDNKWHHACIIFDGVENRIYIDSVQEVVSYAIGSSSTTGSSFFEKIQIGEPTNSAVGYEPNNQVILDDLQIYATALTSEDVKEIYQSRANLDDKGNLSVVSLNQQGVTSISLTEKGVYNTVEISEVGVTEGLIAWYPLNGDAKDYSGNGNDGVVVGATVAAGLGQKCYSFDGTLSYVSSELQSPTNSLTVHLWFKQNPTPKELEMLCGQGNTATLGYWLGLNAGKLTFSVGSSGEDILVVQLSTTIISNLTSWNCFSATFDSSNGIKIIYLNGVEIKRATTLARSIIYDGLNDAAKRFKIGARDTTESSRFFNGRIQDVRIYNRALTPEEVLINYNLTKADKTAMIQSENGTTYVNKIKEV